MPYPSGSAAHDLAAVNAESARQTSIAAATTQALANTADAVAAHALLTSAQKNGVQPGAAITLLYELGLRS